MFKKSSTLAEQALSSIKIVQAFGQESKEDERFSEPLEEARRSGTKYHFISAFFYGLGNGAFPLLFALGLFFGGILVTEGVTNNVRDRDYTPGDIIAVFFGMMFASFSLSVAGPNFQAVTKGRQAAYSALQTIERTPEITIDDENSKDVSDLRGEITLERVSFSYQS